MAATPLSNVLRRAEPIPEPLPGAAVVVIEEQAKPSSAVEDGALKVELPDGGVLIDFDPKPPTKPTADKFFGNLAEEIDDYELNRIASELLMGIQSDDASRQEWLSTHAEGIRLLGLVIEDSRANSGSTSAPLEGMSTARHPLLLEACLFFQALARGELLPAAGPVKVRDDRPQKPAVGVGHNGGPPLDDMPPAGSMADNPLSGALPGIGGAPGAQPTPGFPGGALPGGAPVPPAPPIPPVPPQPSSIPGVAMPKPGEGDDDERTILANALEKDFNHYLTTTAQEFYPDTDRMLFSVGFGGQGVKKVYNCPLRRRPVSESIPMEDFVVSNALTDLGNAARITHRIKMRPSVLKRMQLLGVYRDTYVGTPTQAGQPNAVEQVKADVQGVQPQVQDPKDADYELYECYCELHLDQFAPPQFKGKGLALPYRVTIEKDSQKVLEVRRNWRESDPQCMPKEFFVEFPYDKAFGFYGIGLLHILGNLTKALTAGLRITIDGGMFNNFPAWLYAKGAGRQLSNQFRAAPGQGIGLDVGLQKLQDAVMPLPYKPVDGAWTAYLKQLEDMGRQVGGTANMAVGEGRQDAPVGTTLALIEQATKPVGAVLKRLHTAQSKEFMLLKDRFRDDPEAFWRFNRRPTLGWQKEQFIKALEDFDLVPVSDPNNPTKLHRAAKSGAVTQFQAANPGVLDPRKVWRRTASDLEIDNPDDLLAPIMPPAPPVADPGRMAQAQAKMQGDQIRASTEIEKAKLTAAEGAEARASRIRELEMKIELEREKREAKREAEELKMAGQLAVAAERAHQADRHKALDVAIRNVKPKSKEP